MNALSNPPSQPGPASLAGTLLSTLQEEHAALVLLTEQFDAQLNALLNRDAEQLETATHNVAECMNGLMRLRQTRERQTRLLARVLEVQETSIARLAGRLREDTATEPLAGQLDDIRANVVARAQETQKKGQVLGFALQYAASLGREMMQAVHGIQVPVSSAVYTAAGNVAHALPSTSYVNQVG